MLNAKKSKLNHVNFTGEWKGLYKYELEFEDGTIGTMYKKQENPGVEVDSTYDYTINDKGTIKIIDPNREQNYNTPTDQQATQKYIVRQSSLRSAVEIWKAKIDKGIEFDDNQCIELAQTFEEYVLLNKKPPSIPF